MRRLCLALWCMGMLACGGDGGAGLEAARHLEDARAALLVDDADQALVHVRRVWDAERPDPELAFLGADASLRLGRRNDALEFAEAALSADIELPEDLAADLEWARGKAYAGRYHDLGREKDFGMANLALQRGARAGTHQTQSGMLIVALHVAAGHGGDEATMLKFGRRVLREAPDSGEAETVRQLLLSAGHEP